MAIHAVGELALESADGLLGGLALGDLAVVVGPALAVVAELTDSGDVQGVVDLAVATRVQPITLSPPRGRLDGSGGVVGGEVALGREPADVADVADDHRRADGCRSRRCR